MTTVDSGPMNSSFKFHRQCHRFTRETLFVVIFLLSVFSVAPCTLLAPCSAFALDQSSNSGEVINQYDAQFWEHWGDGYAELSGYSLEFPRYGEVRKGTAVAIFVTEDFSKSARVKADPGKHPADDVAPIMKLNLIQDYQTGIYDYNMMLSSFVTTQPFGLQSLGKPMKTSFASQEWCGHVYEQRIFHKNKLSFQLHSYFDGEADRRGTLDYPEESISEDVLLLWARGLAAPFMKPGETKKINYLTSMEYSRLKHKNPQWLIADLSVSDATEEISIGGAKYRVRRYTAKLSNGLEWNIEVEAAAPHKIIRWGNSEGLKAELLGSKRMKYWELNNNGSENFLKELGL